jgi:hypothetical protein
LRCLAACIRSQTAAQESFAAEVRAVARQQELATCSATDEDVEAFAAWLPKGREAVRRAGAHLEQAAQSAAAARAALRLARAAVLAHDRVINRANLPVSPHSAGSTRTAPQS